MSIATAAELTSVAVSLNSNDTNTIPLNSPSNGMQVEFTQIEYSVPLKNAKRTWTRQGLDAKDSARVILNNVSGRFKAGRLTAVMGASGAGKTSLLSLIAGELTNGKVKGDISLNGEAIHLKTVKKISGFVFQDDLILGTMTVREAIAMSATLRLPREMAAEEKSKKVDDIISLLNLGKCQNTPIGNAYVKGISGGERKRTAIAMELITDPSLLFLDEPTSGLDT